MKRYKYKEYLSHVIPCIYYGLLCGSLTGALIFAFKYCAKWAEEISGWLYGIAKSSPIYIIAALAILALCGFGMYFLHKHIPECRGGGIPRSEGVLRGVLPFRWLKTLIGTFCGSIISFLCGLPLGSEGPAVLMGTSVGKMCVPKRHSMWNRYVMTGGAGAGFAVATGAPLSGILFALEEIHKRFTPMLVLMVSVSVISATYVNRVLCHIFDISANLFHLEHLGEFRFSHIGYLLILGILIAFAVGVFDASIAWFGKLAAKLKRFITAPVKLILVFVTGGIIVFCFTDAAYSGHHMISHVAEGGYTAVTLLAIFVLRLLMMLMVTDSGVTGGIFIPTLAIGASASALIAKLMGYMGMPQDIYPAVVMLGMCAFIGGTLRAPLTASVLFIELTGQFTNMLFVAVVVFTVACITEMFNLKPFYDIALENMEHAQHKGQHPTIAHFKMKVSPNAFVVGKSVRDVMWPHSSVVISITRADDTRTDMDNDGEKKLYTGDTLVIRAKFFDEAELKTHLCALIGNNEIIRE